MNLPIGRPRFSLPQDDKDARGRERTLEEAREKYRYTYNKPNIRGLAMCEEVPREANAGAGWIAKLATTGVKLVDNAIREDLAEGGTGRSLRPDAIAAAVRDDGIGAVLGDVATTVLEGATQGPTARLDDYAQLFQEWRAPAEAAEVFLDSTFARMRVAGPNPAWLTRVDPSQGLPDDLGVTQDHFAAAIGDGDTLEAARADGRLFLSEYRRLADLRRGSLPVPDKIELDYAKDPAAWDAAYKAREEAYAQGAHPKLLVAPLALFAVPPGGGELAPVAIQLFPNGHRGQTYPVFTPRDGLDWLAAKAGVHAADGTVHETIAHLGLTHLVQGAFCLAIHNCLSTRHPLHRLLVPHFEGTLSINNSADTDLVSAGGYVDKLLLPTVGDCIQLAGRAVASYRFNEQIFPKSLALRGTADTQLLPNYPYRDDGLLVWAALERFVRGYIDHHYPSDAEVVADAELQAMVRQVGQYDAKDAAGRTVGGGVRDVGEADGGVQTRGYLAQMITQIIWNGSAQHAAVNFPQGDPMCYAPNYPLTLMGEEWGGRGKTEADYLAQLPFHESAQIQVFILKLLGTIYHTKLGHYTSGPRPRGWFGSRELRFLEEAFQADLEQVEAEIDARDQRRTPYRYLRPSEIPQSINI